MDTSKYNQFAVRPLGTPFIEVLQARAAKAQKKKTDHFMYTNWNLRVGYVYLIYFGVDNYYKIGIAKDIDRRLASMTMMPFEHTVEHLIKTDDTSVIESSFHEYFRNKRVRGEWFNLNDTDIALFKSMIEVTIHGYFDNLNKERYAQELSKKVLKPSAFLTSRH